MGRPHKIGLEYFSFDVDIFDDEKVIPISSEFGAKGECIMIRVLCAIYRNGYFAECSEAFKFKIAKQVNLPYALVSEVILGLVKWGFFNKTVFDSFGVLTSKGIQLRWKEATRKRVLDIDPKYWISELMTEETPVSAPETTLKPSESTQSKGNESKGNEKEVEEKPETALQPTPTETPKQTRKKRVQPDALQFPFSSAEFLRLWDELAATPKWVKKEPSALQASLNQLGRYDERFSIKLIENAIAGRYQGVVFSDTDQAFAKWQRSFKTAVNSKTQIDSPVKDYPGWD